MAEDWVFYGTPIQFSNAVESYWNLKTPRTPCRVIERESNEDRVVLQFLVQGIRAWITVHTIPNGRSKLVISSAGDEEKDNILKQHWDDLVIELRRQGWQINVYAVKQNQDELNDLSTGTLIVPNEIPWIAYGNPYTGGTVVVDQMTGQPWLPLSPLSAAATPHAQRIQHLQAQRQERLNLLHQYEEQESTEDDPRHLLKIRQNIKREKEAIARLNDELMALGSLDNPS